MRILLITGCSPYKAPYLQYYITELIKNNCLYDVIYWNRDDEPLNIGSNFYAFNQVDHSKLTIGKIVNRLRFRHFAISHINAIKYDGVIIFTLQSIPLFYSVLQKKFKNRYIVDIRDYSSLYKIYVLRSVINKCLKKSYANCISSPGFKEWLPKDVEYLLSHNIHQNLINGELIPVNNKVAGPIKILTIGQIRDVEENYSLIKSVANDNKLSLTFIGIGDGIKELERRAIRDGYNNIFFKGKYDKKDENDIVEEYDMINAYMPNNTLSRTLMSNRIYLSLLLGKPIIVTDNSTQADYVKRYNIGLCINNTNNIKDAIISYWKNFDINAFNQGRNNFLKEVQTDIHLFAKSITEFITQIK